MSYAEKIAKGIQAVVAERQIEHVLHFTRLENLPSIFECGLLSRADLAHVDANVLPSDADRLDKEYQAISVSISCYSPDMFEAKRFRAEGAAWAVLVLCPSLLWKHHCLFYERGVTTRETKYASGRRNGDRALKAIFDEAVFHQNQTGLREESKLAQCLPTYPDAEVQVMNSIEPSYIRGVWVETEHAAEILEAFLIEIGREDCEVEAAPFTPRFQHNRLRWG